MCTRHYLFSLGRIVFAASGIALTLGAPAKAQTVQVFDDAPSLEVLRSIMIPESRPGPGRSIVMQRPDTSGATSSVQRTSVRMSQPALAPAPITLADAPAQAPETVSVPAEAVSRQASLPTHDVKPGTVGFRINFAFNSAELPPSAHEMIDRVVQVMKEAPDIKVRVEGHTDAVGSVNYNLDLSERRALSVAEYLVKCGIAPSRLLLVGKGMSEPLTQNPYESANRRVQFVRVG